MSSERLGQKVHVDEGGGGALVTRFLVRASGGDAEHNTGGILDDGNVPIRPDSLVEGVDEIGGFGTDPQDSGVFPIAVGGWYHIDAFAMIEGTGALTTGHMGIFIETGYSEVEPSQTAECFTGTTPRAQVSDTFHFTAGAYFEVHVKTYSVGDSATVAVASITITKLN